MSLSALDDVARPAMKHASAKAFGPTHEVLQVLDDGRDRPTPGKGELLVRVLAVSLSGSDWRSMHGDVPGIKKPAKGFPYVPGGDCCSEVVALGPGVAEFQAGDRVVSTWQVFGEGALAEYATVKASLSAKLPATVRPEEGAALANSAGHALKAVRGAKVKAGDRVLVLGGSGGVGTALVQLARRAGAAYVACTTTNGALVRELGADRVIDYRHSSWANDPLLAKEPVDVVFDCAEGEEAWLAALESRAVKRGKHGGRFVSIHTVWRMLLTSYWDVAKFMAPRLARGPWSALHRGSAPRHSFHVEDVDGKVLAEVLQLAGAGQLKVPLDTRGPFPFTTEGVRAAFDLHESHHARGKVVIKVAD
ncbi:unnamed protein product [Pedinophyceae sp. YPF-701]|nr:unnamed protein product [Pedinophyceae sp. YPF-701]